MSRITSAPRQQQNLSDSVKIRHFADSSGTDSNDCSFTTITQPFQLSRLELSLLDGARTNNVAQVQTALKVHKVNVNTRNNLDRTALHWAAANGHLNIVQILLQAKADVSFVDKYGMTALMWAACNGHVVIVEALMKAGAVATVVNRQGLNAVHCAAMNAHDDVINSIGTSVDINTFCKDDLTALHIAAEKGYINVVNQLLTLKCDAKLKNKAGTTALHLAASAGHAAVIRKLLRYGVEVDETDLNGTTALMMASESGHLNAVKVLLQGKANPNEPNLKRMTSVMLAAFNGHASVVMMLINNGAILNTGNTSKDTALHLAVSNDHRDVVKVLIDSGCDVNAINACKQTALHVAVELGNPEIVSLLLTAGTQLDTKDASGKTALMLAARANFTGIVDMIIKHERLVLFCRPTNLSSLDTTLNSDYTMSANSSPTQQPFDNRPFDEVDHVESKSLENEEATVVCGQSLQQATDVDCELERKSADDDLTSQLSDGTQVKLFTLDGEKECNQLQENDVDKECDSMLNCDEVSQIQPCTTTEQYENLLLPNSCSKGHKSNIAVSCIVHSDDSELSSRYVEGANTTDEYPAEAGHNLCKLEAVGTEPSQDNSTADLSQVSASALASVCVTQSDTDIAHFDDVFPILEISVQAGVCRVQETIGNERTLTTMTLDRTSVETTDNSPSVVDDISSVILQPTTECHLLDNSSESNTVTTSNNQNLNDHSFSLDTCEDELANDLQLRYACFYERKDSVADDEINKPAACVYQSDVHTMTSDNEQTAVTSSQPAENVRADVATTANMERAMREVLWKLAMKQLKGDEWKKLARHWQFTEDHIQAIQQNYSGSNSYRDHGFRMLSIWFHCLTVYQSDNDYNPVVELFEALVAINRRHLAERIRSECDLKSAVGHRKSCIIS